MTLARSAGYLPNLAVLIPFIFNSHGQESTEFRFPQLGFGLGRLYGVSRRSAFQTETSCLTTLWPSNICGSYLTTYNYEYDEYGAITVNPYIKIGISLTENSLLSIMYQSWVNDLSNLNIVSIEFKFLRAYGSN